MDSHLKRKRPVHMTPVERHNAPTIVLVTLCVQPRSAVLGNSTFHDAFQDAAKDADAWSIGFYLVMPDHVHAFCRPATDTRVGIKPWSTYLKRCVSRRLGSRRWQWQSDCWDTQMRSQQHYRERHSYVHVNPVRAGLVNCPDDWPYQGKLNVLNW